MRRRSTRPFEDRLAEEKARLEQQAARLNPGREREDLLRKVRQIDIASHVNAWISSTGLQPPK